jgi:hypothetical protein
MARGKNQDAASLRFLTLVQQCLDCHAYIRER